MLWVVWPAQICVYEWLVQRKERLKRTRVAALSLRPRLSEGKRLLIVAASYLDEAD
jgi:hypothetical protein